MFNTKKARKKKVVIIGAGVAGLAAGYYFSKNPGYEVIVVENWVMRQICKRRVNF